uniref:hypothetical protein n=1 Tax=Chitinimonas sp. TaxID=1934313 RepID=UPI0035AED2D7
MRDPALQHIERPGLGKRFPRFSAYKKKAEKNLSMVDLLLSYPLLCRYAKEGPGFPYNLAGLIEPYGAPKAYLDMGNMGGGAYGAQLMYVALDQGDWLPHFRQYMVWMYWYWRIEFAWFRKYQRAGNIPFGPSTTTCLIVKFFSGYIGELLYLGWIEQAIDLSRSACWALEAGFGSNLHGSAQSQYFLLCLMADWQGWPRPKMSPGTLDDPLLTLLLAHWRTPEPDDLHDLLLALCDRR